MLCCRPMLACLCACLRQTLPPNTEVKGTKQHKINPINKKASEQALHTHTHFALNSHTLTAALPHPMIAPFLCEPTHLVVFGQLPLLPPPSPPCAPAPPLCEPTHLVVFGQLPMQSRVIAGQLLHQRMYVTNLQRGRKGGNVWGQSDSRPGGRREKAHKCEDRAIEAAGRQGLKRGGGGRRAGTRGV